MNVILPAVYFLWECASAVAIAGSFIWLSTASDYGPVGATLTALGALTVFAAGVVSMCFAWQGMFAATLGEQWFP